MNPIIKGLYADPDIACFQGRYYLYPTTDGFTHWSGTQFHVFSSENLTEWMDHGVILDLASEDVPWATGSAWAPCIAQKGGLYYFYFCGKRADGVSCIGVASAEHPAGPFRAQKEPLLWPELCREMGIKIGQTIDPSFYMEEDGTPYLLFGNGDGVVVELNDDMVSIKKETMKNYEGLKDFREAVTVLKRQGVYHFTWSCDDTGSDNYHVNYGISHSIYGPVEYKGTILQKVPEQNILGTGHHCIFKIPGKDEYYMGYHRFGTPLEHYDKDKKGFNRELCLEPVSFDETTGLMNSIVPTIEGVGHPVSLYDGYLFVYFTDNTVEGENIFFAYSEDGLHFHELNHGKPILTSKFGEKGLRDPFLLRSVQGDTFYLVATDLSIGRNGDWRRAQREGSSSIMVWESSDLIHWSEQRMVTIARADAGCAWAPEFIYDEERGAYMVFWASKVAEDNYAKQRLYCAWTKDFVTFSEPQLYIDRERDTIDTSIIKYKGDYYRMTKDERQSNIILETSSELNGTWTMVDAPVLNEQQGVEGPEFYRINGSDQVCVIVDQYGRKGYYPLITEDLSSGQFRMLEKEEYSLPYSRHGSVISITGEELNRLKEKLL